MEGSRRVWTFLELGEDGEWRRCWSTRGPLPTLRTGASFSGSVAWTTFATTFASHPLVTRVSVLHARASLCVISYLGTRARQGTVLQNSLLYFISKIFISFKKNFKFFIEVQLIYNVLFSGVQHSDSVYIYIHMCACVSLCVCVFRFFSLIGYYKILSIDPCAIWQVLVAYLFYTQQYVYGNPKFLIFPSFCFGDHMFVFHVCGPISEKLYF